MASFTCKILALFTICMALQEGCGLPLSQQPEQAPPHPRHIRTKRCSCYNWEDKECIYFCHLDIIWINTPSKLLPYGMGSPLSRRRRSANRCECHDPADNTCRGFCHKSSENPGTEAAEPTVEPASIKSNRLLASLRAAIESNAAVAKQNPSGVIKLKSRTRRQRPQAALRGPETPPTALSSSTRLLNCVETTTKV